MTPLEHNKYVGLAHLVYGVMHVLLTGVSMLFMGAIFSTMRLPDVPDSDFSPQKFMLVIMVFAVVVNIVLSIPSFVASYSFLKRKPWAKVIGIIAAVVAAMHFPLGTAACVYTFWFLFSDAGKTLYGPRAQTLPPLPPSDWARVEQQGLYQSYAPDMQPDWRG